MVHGRDAVRGILRDAMSSIRDYWVYGAAEKIEADLRQTEIGWEDQDPEVVEARLERWANLIMTVFLDSYGSGG